MKKDTNKTGHLSDMRQDILRQDSEGIETVQVMRQDIIQTVTSHNTGNEAGHKTDSEKGHNTQTVTSHNTGSEAGHKKDSEKEYNTAVKQDIIRQ